MDLILIIFSLLVLLFSVIIHELAHGYVAQSLGDPTAKYSGRLTLNPISHLDPFGSVILPLAMLLLTRGAGPVLGWAKPVPINPYNFRDQQWGSLKVAIAGPLSNFSLALVFGLLLRFIPLPSPLMDFFATIVVINLMLALFNLIPIPPLDGHWILFTFLPDSLNNVKTALTHYGTYIVLFLVIFGGLGWLLPIMESLFHIITGF